MSAQGGLVEFREHIHWGSYSVALYFLSPLLSQSPVLYDVGFPCHPLRNEAGDFLYIPPGVPHQPTNLSDSEPAQALVSRNDSNEQENVVLYSV